MRALATALSLGAVFLLTMLLLIWWGQERIVFQPSGPPFPDASGSERIRYRAADGQELFAYIVGRRPGEPLHILLVFHGNADLAAWQIPWAAEVASRTGWTVMLAEYRGYGGLSGTPSVAGARLDATAAARVATDTLHAVELAIYGHSLGSAIAADLAATVPATRLILVSPFSSAREMARIVVARPVEWVWSLISRVHYDTRARVRELDVPVWVAHGERDLVIPAWMGREVFDAARHRGELLIVPEAGHNDLAIVAGERYWRWMERALARLNATS